MVYNERIEMKLYLVAQGMFRSSIHAFAHKTLRKPQNGGVSLQSESLRLR